MGKSVCLSVKGPKSDKSGIGIPHLCSLAFQTPLAGTDIYEVQFLPPD